MLRRSFLGGLAGLPVCGASAFDLSAFERTRVLRGANGYLHADPLTVTAATSPRSAGGTHDFFSEGDYWWPDPKNPNGPYIQRDGMTNPGNFTKHREFLIRLSLIVPALTAAYKLTRDKRYSTQAAAICAPGSWTTPPA